METYDFESAKKKVVEYILSNNAFTVCYIVRTIYSRFSIYTIGTHDFELFVKQLKNVFPDILDSIEEISEEKDFFIVNDLKKTSAAVEGANNVFFSERHAENTNWYINDSFKLSAPVTSFYSFKGGVGRTTAAVLTSMLLARQGKRVMIIDFDLEAPGLASLFANKDDNADNFLKVKGFVDFLVEYDAHKRDLNKINIDDYYFVQNDQTLIGNKGGELIIVPAIATSTDSASSYLDKLSKVNLKYGAGRAYMPDVFLKELDKKIRPDIIIIDSRTGINDVGGLVFNRYSQNLFLLFYGNQQNMFGLESIVPELKKLNEKDVQFYLLNSPVPKNETDANTVTDYYVERSYEIFKTHIYDDNSIPDQFDETANHFPINIPFNDQALVLNSYKKLSALIDSSNNAYKKISDIILSNFQDEAIPEPTKKNDLQKENILDCIKKIDPVAGTAELEYKNEDDLTKYFYPRKDYKYIFEQDKFLVLGEKGVGKTALFSVLKHPHYTRALAEYCGVKTDDLAQTTWIIGVEKDSPDFPQEINFESLGDFEASQLTNYWILLMLRSFGSDSIPSTDLTREIINSTPKYLKDIASRKHIGEELVELLQSINESIKIANKTYIVVYDHLDAIMSNKVRGKLVSALLSFFYGNIIRLSNIKAKIFLRNDIFEREVNDITDKVKIQNYSVKIQWEYNQLLNVIWKRIYEQDKTSELFTGFTFEKKETLGSIPMITTETEHKLVLDKLFGKAMGGNNKTFPYNWVKSHIEDTNEKIHPRTLIKLFAESAALQEKDLPKDQPKDRIIRSKNIETALSETVSKHQIQELGEEYKEYDELFKKLSDNVGGRSPMDEEKLVEALKNLGFKSDPIKTIQNLIDIGLLKKYKPVLSKTKDNETKFRYHFPDLYLYGLNLTRKGTR